MGNNVSLRSLYESGPVPDTDAPSTFDPLLGFPNGRKERVMIATQQEMEAAKIEPEMQDYCAHMFLKYLGCQRREYPFMYKCAPELHAYDQCQYEDYVLRMKEFERERRLLARQQKKQAALQATAA